MTDLQKQRIVQMRAEGKQYKEIAEGMGLSLGRVKMFMSRRKVREKNPRCEQCGKVLRNKLIRPTRRFCSAICRVNWWTQHPEQMKKEHSFRCEQCGKDFYSRKPKKFCSRTCYYASRRVSG